MNPIVFKEGKLVVLRPILEDDLPRLMRWINDPDIRRFITRRLPAGLQEERQWIEKVSSGGDRQVALAIITKNNGRHIGTIDIHIDWLNRIAILGVMIGEKDYQGNGYGTDAMMTMLHYAFADLNLHKITLSVFAYNERARHCYAKCGFTEEGLFKEHRFIEGAYVDQIMMAVFRDKFLTLWTAYRERFLSYPLLWSPLFPRRGRATAAGILFSTTP